MTPGAALSLEHLRLALEALDDGVIVLDGELQVLFVNAALRTALGHEPTASSADLLERAGFDVVRTDGTPWPLEERPVQRAAQAGQTSRRLLMGLTRGGETRWVRVSAWPLAPGTGQGAVGTYCDVTHRERDRRALVESEAHFRLLAENSTDVITRHAADGTCLYASPALREVLGRAPEELEGSLATDFVHPEDRERLLTAHVALLRSGEGSTVSYRMAHLDGSWVWVETVMRPVRATDGRVLELQSSTRDVTARVQSEQRLARLALGDPLTGLANRAALLQRLEDLLDARVPLALLFLDLDRFKVVNDSLGHSAGDELLRTVAGRLAGACRDGDLVARLGGDEFVVVAARLDEAGAVQLAGRVQRVLAAPVEVSGHELVASASLGIVVHDGSTDDERDAEALLRDADVSMYRAKAAGRARAVVWTEGTGEGPVERLMLENELRTALEQGQISVHYQPQVELATGCVVGVEALARWAHPTRGLLLPGAFLAVADETGLLVELGRQVLHAAARQVVAWRRLPGCEALTLSVNLSGRELLEPAALEFALGVLEETGLPPAALTLEVLESVLLDAEGQVVAALGRYVEHGVRLALDDFGTGSSSLLHLRRVPVSTVKIDRSFVLGLGRSRQDEAVVRALTSLTKDLGMACIAEGVEDDAQRRWLLDQGVTVAQGYLLHRPLPAAALEALLRRAGREQTGG
ncbi:MAG: EAL domain-containing protein [Frankiaceae bacterium]|nr:EAL domain-containing protein [Frankiaceae bacterium]